MGTSISEIYPDVLFTGLNTEQAGAVSADLNNHILVLAGAGCGKTTVLTRRIAYLVYNDIPPESIIALTFTRKAADEMQARVGLAIDKTSDLLFPLITTFHGFALRVLSEKINGITNFERIGFSHSIRLIDSKERLSLLAKVSTSQERRSCSLDIMTLDSLLARFEVFPENIRGVDQSKIMFLKTVHESLISEKRKEGLWDFSDLLTGCHQLFKCFPDVLSLYQGRYQAVLVDEFQDTNPLQIDILRMLLGDTVKVFAVGDDDQAIYSFRGADIRPTLEFRTIFDSAQIVKLQTNYRSVSQILHFANRIFKDKDPQYRKVLVSGKTHQIVVPRKPSWKRFENQEMMIRWVKKNALSLHLEHGIPITSMAMLFRVNQSIETTSTIISNSAPDIADITMMTIHKCKGLEFPVVFLCDLEESIFPSYRMPDRRKITTFTDFVKTLIKKRKPIDCDWDEEKRLFYVGVTRAQQFLYLVSVRNKNVYGRPRKFEYSRFCKLL